MNQLRTLAMPNTKNYLPGALIFVIGVCGNIWWFILQLKCRKLTRDMECCLGCSQSAMLSLIVCIPWWRYQMETFSALLAICAENWPVPGEFPAQSPVTRSFDIFFDMRLNGWLNKQSWGWWFETPWRPLWRHSNAFKQDIHYMLQWRPRGDGNGRGQRRNSVSVSKMCLKYCSVITMLYCKQKYMRWRYEIRRHALTIWRIFNPTKGTHHSISLIFDSSHK